MYTVHWKRTDHDDRSHRGHAHPDPQCRRSAGHRWADIPLSKLKVEVARLLKENAFVYDYKVLNDGRHGIVRVYLKYYEGRHVIRRIERVSRPGWRRYVGRRRDSPDPQRSGHGHAVHVEGSPLGSGRPGSAGRRRSPRGGLVGGTSMSRIGKQPVPCSRKGVTVTLDGRHVRGEGPEGRTGAAGALLRSPWEWGADEGADARGDPAFRRPEGAPRAPRAHAVPGGQHGRRASAGGSARRSRSSVWDTGCGPTVARAPAQPGFLAPDRVSRAEGDYLRGSESDDDRSEGRRTSSR